MLNIEYVKTLPSDEFAKVINRCAWCLKDNTCDAYANLMMVQTN